MRYKGQPNSLYSSCGAARQQVRPWSRRGPLRQASKQAVPSQIAFLVVPTRTCSPQSPHSHYNLSISQGCTHLVRHACVWHIWHTMQHLMRVHTYGMPCTHMAHTARHAASHEVTHMVRHAQSPVQPCSRAGTAPEHQPTPTNSTQEACPLSHSAASGCPPAQLQHRSPRSSPSPRPSPTTL